MDALKVAVIKQFRAVRQRTWRDLCEEVGVPYDTAKKVVYGQIQNPRIDTLEPFARHWGLVIDYRKRR